MKLERSNRQKEERKRKIIFLIFLCAMLGVT